jgi:hypothetical protein
MNTQEYTECPESVQYAGRRTPRPRSELLAEIKILPDDAYMSAAHAAAFLDTNITTLANWRSQRRGPRYEGARGFIRYRLTELKRFMATHANQPWEDYQDQRNGERA